MATISKQEGGSNRSKLRPPSQNIQWKLKYGNFDFCRWVVVIDRFDQVTALESSRHVCSWRARWAWCLRLSEYLLFSCRSWVGRAVLLWRAITSLVKSITVVPLDKLSRVAYIIDASSWME
jgi:hypothetical protein